jgi:hypothetical protein
MLVNLLRHPRIYLFNAALAALGLPLTLKCIFDGNMTGAAFNGFFLVFNATAAIGNFLFRQQRATMLEEEKMERRNQLIRLTIGE